MKGCLEVLLLLEMLRRGSKGLSPIFATLIILAVVTTLFIPVFIWASGLTSTTENSWRLSGEEATERIVIEEVNLLTGKVYVRNIGETAVAISNIIISKDNQVLETYSKGDISTVKPATESTVAYTAKGDLVEVHITDLGFAPSAGTYSIQVATERGVSDNYLVVVSSET